ncbi:hypothetical protein [Xanthomonas translucens]|uniref:hypothetical protein n=1 Tax=Xanthomonas campestris pv. translucens TaxID=343 RepID=UPI0013E8BC06|nr:hypothetical protein [Xanthomonas translucens]MCS3361790.1 hypothetical protein [Xanthomonas translucens pv. translucens]MCS3372587.1 hypothetical protein [Xanthomonas translucens pv. translucens]MCT8280190.1 hypothetical protein [Xanthomonas translucens pv. translucens]MCT8288919.1 hypothetical protein [Xanthomonas translucens pv. translucens]MCT8309122.1 hypothetical protein [Xanthomonas translucens pv. translucens]
MHSTGPAIGQINPQWSAMLLAHVRNAKIFSTIITLPRYKYDKKNRSISQATCRETALRRIRSGGKKKPAWAIARRAWQSPSCVSTKQAFKPYKPNFACNKS